MGRLQIHKLAMAVAFFALTLFYTNCSSFAPGELSELSQDNRRCKPGSGTTGSPRSMEEAIALINSLPMPVDVGCFLESLDRPLRIYASNSVTSAQPAAGNESPRIFVFIGPLIIAVVPDGSSRRLVEFSVVTSDRNSIKGEIELPVTQPIDTTLAYDHVSSGGGTRCAFCHAGEVQVASITTAAAYESIALKPRPETLVPVAVLRAYYDTCNASTEPERCAILDGIFDHGTVVHQDFPATFDIF